MNWFMNFGTTNQILYYMERPRFTFHKKKTEKNHKIIYQYQKEVTWIPINIEAPTRVLPETQGLIDSKKIDKLIFRLIDVNGRLVEEWYVDGVEIVRADVKRARMVDSQVINIEMKYKWSRRVK